MERTQALIEAKAAKGIADARRSRGAFTAPDATENTSAGSGPQTGSKQAPRGRVLLSPLKASDFPPQPAPDR